jgi:hypothetical protein
MTTDEIFTTLHGGELEVFKRFSDACRWRFENIPFIDSRPSRRAGPNFILSLHDLVEDSKRSKSAGVSKSISPRGKGNM